MSKPVDIAGAGFAAGAFGPSMPLPPDSGAAESPMGVAVTAAGAFGPSMPLPPDPGAAESPIRVAVTAASSSSTLSRGSSAPATSAPLLDTRGGGEGRGEGHPVCTARPLADRRNLDCIRRVSITGNVYTYTRHWTSFFTRK